MLGVAFLLAVVAYSAADFRKGVRHWRVLSSPEYIDEVSLSDRNCAAIRDQLPPRGRVGFRDATPTDGRHAVTQYSLAPLVVWRDATLPVVVEREGNSVRVSRPGGQ